MAQLTGQGPTALPASGTTNTYLAPYPIKVGTRARDVDGNEYVFCDFGGPVSQGIWVTINTLHVANAVVANDTGRIGVVCGGVGPAGTELTSTLGGWVQIYGLCNYAQTNEASDVNTTQGILLAGKVATSPAGTVGYVSLVSTDGTRIYGAWSSQTVPTPIQAGIVGATDSSWPTTYVTNVTDNAALGTGHSGQIIAVWLNYPYVAGGVDGFMLGNATSIGAA